MNYNLNATSTLLALLYSKKKKKKVLVTKLYIHEVYKLTLGKLM